MRTLSEYYQPRVTNEPRFHEEYVVYKTSNYDLFTFLQGNRDLNKAHLMRLKNSFKKKQLISLIICNEKMQVIDGKHRLEVARELGLPVYFIIIPGYGLSEMQVFNSNMMNWTKYDFLNSWCHAGHSEYLAFRNFMRRFPQFGFAACETLLTQYLTTNRNTSSPEVRSETNKKGTYTIKYFEEGELQIPNYEYSVQCAEKILMISPYYDGFSRKLFVSAILGVFQIENYSHDQFMARLKANPTWLKHCATVGQYRLMIEDLYNFRSREKVSLRF